MFAYQSQILYIVPMTGTIKCDRYWEQLVGIGLFHENSRTTNSI